MSDVSYPQGTPIRTVGALFCAGQNIDEACRDLAFAIDATPTGEKRNKLTEVNIHLMAAASALKEAKEIV
jgi:hypothetical protein